MKRFGGMSGGLDRGNGRTGVGHVDIAAHHMRAVARKAEACSLTDPFRGADDECTLARQVEEF